MTKPHNFIIVNKDIFGSSTSLLSEEVKAAIKNISHKWGRGEERGKRQQLCKLETLEIQRGKTWEGVKETSTSQPRDSKAF